MSKNIKQIDITENVVGGDVNHLISVLKRWAEIGYCKLYFDGYEAAVYLYKEECSEKQDHRMDKKIEWTYESAIYLYTEWRSVKEKLPELEKLVEVRRMGFGWRKVSLTKMKDDCMYENFSYHWIYPSGLRATRLEIEDEWREIEGADQR